MSSPARDWLGWAAPLGLAGLVGLAGLGHGFVLDDFPALVQHPLVTGRLPLSEAFLLDQWGSPISAPALMYRPLWPILWRFLWQLFPGEPLPFRILTLVLHLAATGLVLAAGRRFLADRALAAATAVLFAVHPVHAEVLGSSAHHNEIVALVLGLAALLAADTRPRSAASVGLLLLAVLVKESAIVFFPIVLLHLWCRRMLARPVAAGLVTVAAILVAIQLAIPRQPFIIGNLDNLAFDARGWERLWHGLYTVGRGTALMLLPVGLAPFHGYAALDLDAATLMPQAGLGLTTLAAGAAALGLGLARRRPLPVLAAGLACGPLLLQSNLLVRTYSELAERWLYTPSLVVCGLAAFLLLRLLPRLGGGAGRWGRLGLVVLLSANLAQTVRVLAAWRDNPSLVAFGVAQEPAAYQSRYFHAKYLLEAGSLEEGLWFATTAAMIRDSYLASRGRAGHARFAPLAELDRLPVAARFGRAPQALDPDDPCRWVRQSLAATAGLAPPPPPAVLGRLAWLYATQGYGACLPAATAPPP
ncbi:MAG: hypothetical protein AB1634_16890 [Thermodesulfobacteriota bacterium]